MPSFPLDSPKNLFTRPRGWTNRSIRSTPPSGPRRISRLRSALSPSSTCRWIFSILMNIWLQLTQRQQQRQQEKKRREKKTFISTTVNSNSNQQEKVALVLTFWGVVYWQVFTRILISKLPKCLQRSSIRFSGALRSRQRRRHRRRRVVVVDRPLHRRRNRFRGGPRRLGKVERQRRLFKILKFLSFIFF